MLKNKFLFLLILVLATPGWAGSSADRYMSRVGYEIVQMLKQSGQEARATQRWKQAKHEYYYCYVHMPWYVGGTENTPAAVQWSKNVGTVTVTGEERSAPLCQCKLA